jgi:hypothetical protein
MPALCWPSCRRGACSPCTPPTTTPSTRHPHHTHHLLHPLHPNPLQPTLTQLPTHVRRAGSGNYGRSPPSQANETKPTNHAPLPRADARPVSPHAAAAGPRGRGPLDAVEAALPGRESVSIGVLHSVHAPSGCKHTHASRCTHRAARSTQHAARSMQHAACSTQPSRSLHNRSWQQHAPPPTTTTAFLTSSQQQQFPHHGHEPS